MDGRRWLMDAAGVVLLILLRLLGRLMPLLGRSSSRAKAVALLRAYAAILERADATA